MQTPSSQAAATGPTLAALAAALVAAGCSTTASDMPPAPPVPAAEVAVLNGTPVTPEYRIQVGDVLALRFYLNPELNEEVTVRPDGKISTTLAEEVPAAGATVPELTAALRAAYRAELQTPRLVVAVKSFAPTRVFVGGEVATPGEYTSAGPGLTLSQAIARAGGLKPAGSPDRVFILRRVGGTAAAVYGTRYRDVITGRDPQADVVLAPYDVVYVPRTSVAQAYAYFNQYVQQFLPVTWGFSYVLNPGSTTSVVQSPSR